MENKQLFSSIGYVVWSDFTYQDKVKVKVFFIYKEFHVRTKTLFIKKIKGKDESYYQNEAKRIINKMINDGSLEKECEKEVKRKKSLLVLLPIVSAMAIAGIAVGCIFGLNGNGGATPIVYHTIKFSDNSLNCKMYDVVEPYGEVTSKEWEAGEIARYKIKGNNGYGFPSEDQVTFMTDSGESFDGLHSYDPSTGELSVKMTANVTITAKTEEFHWFLDNDNFLSKLTEEDVTKDNGDGTIGVVKTLKVNGQEHNVRLIGVDQDEFEDGTTAHTTWEFENLLSDENGYSLAAYWKDTATGVGSNYSYNDSTIRAVLNGSNYEGSSKEEINWFQYFGDEHDEDTNLHFSEAYSGKSVIDMLPTDLVHVLKAPKKNVPIYNNGWQPQEVKDKLFLLSPSEMGYSDASFGDSAYKYYEGHTQPTEPIRVKKQIKGSDTDRHSFSSRVDLDGKYNGMKASYAGFNALNVNNGSNYWTRVPYINENNIAWFVNSIGLFVVDGGSADNTCNRAYNIAPAFCI